MPAIDQFRNPIDASSVSLRLPCLGLGGASPAAADAASLGSLQVLRRNPALIIRLCAGRNSGPINTTNSNLIARVGALRSGSRALRLVALTATALLREESCNPSVVNEPAGETEQATQEEVEEDTNVKVSGAIKQKRLLRWRTFAGQRC